MTKSEILFKSGTRKTVVDQRSVNASAQVLSERLGNGVVSVAEYSDSDGRLTRLSAHLKDSAGKRLQDLLYSYDRVGNVLRIRDAAQPTRWAGNAQVEAVSTFEYDSLSRLIKATGRENARNTGASALPGRVSFGAKDDNLWGNYTRHYTYDSADNLTQMRHVPSTGSGYTQRMQVGEHSNHGVIAREGAKAPGLGNGFDHSGNLQALAPGQALTWNGRNQLVRVAQVLRDNGEHDDETYLYDGAGQRVVKRRVAHGKTQAHTHEVLYLPGLELHRHGPDGEWLNVVLAQGGRHSVRGLQWEQGRPAEMQDEQLRFGLDDHLGSSTLELDDSAGLLSQESYYPFGTTAWWAAKSALEASYKSRRYSGKERDASGLYYYGFRYYAPWLLRWISADPAGAVDGLNLYTMVGNNPIGYVDDDGLQRRSMLEVVTVLLLVLLIGHGVGLEVGYRVELAYFGLISGVVGIVLYANQRLSTTEVRRRAFYEQSALAGAQELGRRQGATEQEVSELADFFLEHRLATVDTKSLSYGLTPAARGGLYGYIGPTERREQAETASRTERNPSFTLARLGFVGIELRAPARKVGASPLPPAGLTHTEVQPQTRVTSVGRRGSAPEEPVAQPVSPGPSSGLQPERLVIDVEPVLTELRGQGGGIIRNVINRLEARTLDFHTGHAMAGGQNVRSFDLLGYHGQRGRGAYRVLIQHVSGLNYRAVRVMNPHRR
ncbi:RHS repeat-associated core domain-containing protein [Pseudomonas fluorescens]